MNTVTSGKCATVRYAGQVIHHINGDRTDNRIENLQVLPKLEHDALESRRVWQLRASGKLPPISRPQTRFFDVADLVNMIRAGCSVREIGRRLNTSKSTILRHLRSAGFEVTYCRTTHTTTVAYLP